jgi:SAM-dependent methyltransferase
MPKRPIVQKDADTYIKNVENHGIEADTQWLINEGRFPVGCCVIDVGSGTGRLAIRLGAEAEYYRTVIGIELSPELVVHATKQVTIPNVSFVEDDFLEWESPANFRANTLVMSYYLHHCDDRLANLQKAASLFDHGGRFYVFDRIAADHSAVIEFQQFWEREYRDAHEWDEELPNIYCAQDLIEAATAAGFRFVRSVLCPHDRRAGAERFPKRLLEFWRQETGHRFPAVALVSPAHQKCVGEIINELAVEGMGIKQRNQVAYTGDLIQNLYEHCPWKEYLAGFVAKVCPHAIATALILQGDSTDPRLLQQLIQFKKRTRRKWDSICGSEFNGIRPMILPFHVAEPHECETLVRLLRIEERN